MRAAGFSFLFLFLTYFSRRGQRCLRDQCAGRSHEKERSQEGTGSNGERWIQGWQQVTGATSAGLQGGVTGSAPVSDLAVAANAPKIAGGRGAGSARAGQEGHPLSKRGLVPGLSPAKRLRRARGADSLPPRPRVCLGKGKRSQREEEEEEVEVEEKKKCL